MKLLDTIEPPGTLTQVFDIGVCAWEDIELEGWTHWRYATPDERWLYGYKSSDLCVVVARLQP